MKSYIIEKSEVDELIKRNMPAVNTGECLLRGNEYAVLASCPAAEVILESIKAGNGFLVSPITDDGFRYILFRK